MTDLYDAPPEFAARLTRIINAYHPDLSRARIQLQVRDKAPTRYGATTWGETDTADNAGEEKQFDFTMWFALDAWAALGDGQRDALMDHECSHCGWDDEGKPYLIPHDIEEFNGVIARHGLWWPDAQATIEALTIAPPPYEAGAEREMEMAHEHRIIEGNHGSVGAYQRPMPGGSSGSTGAYQAALPGNHGSVGAFQGETVYSDPALQPGDSFHTVPIGDGKTIELCPQCYAQLVQSILSDLAAAAGQGA